MIDLQPGEEAMLEIDGEVLARLLAVLRDDGWYLQADAGASMTVVRDRDRARAVVLRPGVGELPGA